MLQNVDVGDRSLESYRRIAPNDIIDELRARASVLRGARVVHINATPYGGGVSEILRSAVPLLNDLGIVADWKIISGDDKFFDVTKRIHNGLQGAAEALSEEQKATYLANARLNARAFEEQYDFVFINDPQPAAMLEYREKGSGHWIWRCHIDTSQPNPEVWAFVRSFLRNYDAAVFTMPDFVPPDLPIELVRFIPPAIDPLSPKNLELPEPLARQILDWIGVSSEHPLITQVSRFDPWKDPLGVISAYRMVREQVPDLQLALVGSMALDDPQGWDIYRQISAESEADPLIHVFTNLTGVGNIEVNAFQALSKVVVQKSLREGFGLVVSEALWKGTPVVAGRAGGIPLQFGDGDSGVLVDTVDECAQAILNLLERPDEARDRGQRGRERVRQHFLMPRLLLNEVMLMEELIQGRPIGQREAGALPRDLVCGMVITEGQGVVSAMFEGREYRFDSEYCRRRFLASPGRYVVKA
jgi:trehalose synthase